jgi:hypothetical protein
LSGEAYLKKMTDVQDEFAQVRSISREKGRSEADDD